MAGNEVNIRVVADTKKAVDGMGRLQKSMERWRVPIRNAGIAMAAMGAALGALGVSSIKAAADAEEAASKFAITFGPAAVAVGKSMDEFARAVGRSRFELREMAADTGSVVRALGFQEDAAGELSSDLVKLAVDVGSFQNVQQAQVIRAFTSALTGERESLKTLGIVINEAQVQAKAFALGLGETASELTTAEKAQATYQLLLERTVIMQGDAARTAGSFTNQTIQLRSMLKDLQVTIGRELIPAILPLIKSIASVVKRVSEWSQANPELMRKVTLAAGAVGVLALAVGGLLLVLPGIIAIAPVVGAAITAMFGPVGIAVVALGALGAAYATNFLGIRDITNQAVGALVKLYKSWVGWFLPGGALIKGILFLKKNWREVLDFMIDKWFDMVNMFQDGFSKFLLPVINKFREAIGKDAIEPLKELERETTFVERGIRNAANALAEANTTVTIFSEAIDALDQKFANAVAALDDVKESTDEANKSIGEMVTLGQVLGVALAEGALTAAQATALLAAQQKKLNGEIEKTLGLNETLNVGGQGAGRLSCPEGFVFVPGFG